MFQMLIISDENSKITCGRHLVLFGRKSAEVQFDTVINILILFYNKPCLLFYNSKIDYTTLYFLPGFCRNPVNNFTMYF